MIAVVPRAGTWIETNRKDRKWKALRSFPVRERGLKLDEYAEEISRYRSFPVRERGLKLGCRRRRRRLLFVVPRAGTWIETSLNPTR